MATKYSPRIVTDGLIFLIDPASTRCVGIGDTSCLDLVGGKRCSGASGNPGTGAHTEAAANFPDISKWDNSISDYGSYVFSFDDGDGINIDGDLGSHSTGTWVVWIYKKDSVTDYLFDFRNNGGSWVLLNYSGSNINAHNALEYNFTNTSAGEYSAADFPLSKWIQVVIISDTSESKIYLNGTERAAYRTTSLDEDLGINARIGCRYTTATFFNGNMGPIYFYDRALSAGEVTQNYLAHAGRYQGALCPESSF
jgi:hypothetical protein